MIYVGVECRFLACLYGPEALSFDAQSPELVFDTVREHPQVLPALVHIHTVTPGGHWDSFGGVRLEAAGACICRCRHIDHGVHQPGVVGVSVDRRGPLDGNPFTLQG